ncbi:hypothetical protein VTO73DRAFT_9037 [Trametes versicolor]
MPPVRVLIRCHRPVATQNHWYPALQIQSSPAVPVYLPQLCVLVAASTTSLRTARAAPGAEQRYQNINKRRSPLPQLCAPRLARRPSAHRNDGVTESATRSHPLLSSKSRSDSATNLELEPEPQSHTIYTDQKDCEFDGEELPECPPSFSAPPSTDHLSDRADSPADWDAAPLYTPVPPALETAGTQGDRNLHLALPWVFGQRVLAMMASEDARSVESGGSEPLPAYEPRE